MDYFFLIILILFIVSLFLSRNLPPSSKNNLNITEEDIVDCLRNGYRLNAIRLFRDLHGVSLAEARKAIKEIEKTL